MTSKVSASSRAVSASTGVEPRRSRRGLSTRDALVGAAERLIGEQGLARVSVAQIARAADQRSRAAPQYYFKSLEDMALAVVERRGPGVRARRAAMLQELDLSGRGHDIRALVEAAVLPVTTLLGSSGAHFRCVIQLNALTLADRAQWLDEADLEFRLQWEDRLHAELKQFPAAVRTQRINMALDLCMTTLATLEAQLESQEDSVDIAFASTTLVDAVTAILTGPDHTRRQPA
jgi:AcrR family transcriptional regulator